MRLLFVIAAAGIALLILEGVSMVLARLSASLLSIPIPDRAKFYAYQSMWIGRVLHDPAIRARIHPVLGWEYQAGRVTETEHMNTQGLRARREYAPEPPPGVRRIAAFGDSYVYCAEVADAQSWPELVEQRWKAEVLNYGVGGYGVDQALLRFQDNGARLKPEIVVLGFTTMMATRMVSRYRRFEDPRDGAWFKPRFVLEGDSLDLIPSPVASRHDMDHLLANPAKVTESSRNDFWYAPAVFEHWLYPKSATYRLLSYAWFRIERGYFNPDRIRKGRVLNTGSESFRILVRVFKDFAAAVRREGAEPVVLMLPARSDVAMYRDSGKASYETLRIQLASLELRVIDLAMAFTTSPEALEELFTPGGHYSPKGNAVVGEAMAEALGLVPRT